MALPFFTVGHSDRDIATFVALLREADIGFVADIRKMPMSRANPQFNHDVLSASLGEAGIAYAHEAALGGLRGRQSDVPARVNGFWRNRSFHHYADYALSDAFHAGLEAVRTRGRERRCVLMCAEAVWWRCHRRIVADYLLAGGESVFHLMGHHRLEPARLTPAAVRRPDGTLVYPAGEEAA